MRVFLIILGALLAMGGVACGASGIAAYRAVDSDGFVSAGGHMSTVTAAFVSDTAEFEDIDDGDAGRVGKVRIRIRAESHDGNPVFIGIGPAAFVEQAVSSGSFEVVRSFDWDPFRFNGVQRGETAPQPRFDRSGLVAMAEGPGRQEVVWRLSEGSWRVIIMNADGSPGVDVEASFGARFPYLRQFAIVAMVLGAFLLLLGVLLIVFQARRKPAAGSMPPMPAGDEPPPATG